MMKHTYAAVAVTAAVITLSGCSTTADGTPFADPVASAEFRAPGAWLLADDPALKIEGNDVDDPINGVVELAVADTSEFWQRTDSSFVPPKAYAALEEPAYGEKCFRDLTVAAACDGGGLAWNTTTLNAIHAEAGDLGVLTVVAHEMAHHVQMSHDRPRREREADCLGGVYLRYVVNGIPAEGSPRRFHAKLNEVSQAATVTNKWVAQHFPSDTTSTTLLQDRDTALSIGLMGDPQKCFDMYGLKAE